MWQSKKVLKPEEQVGGPPEKLNKLSACMWQSKKVFKPEEQCLGYRQLNAAHRDIGGRCGESWRRNGQGTAGAACMDASEAA
ncbi:hypothetical protein GDO81_007987 [Engystomops pustulosus]|uniref:Uncharacterized protein n=1 Tax=Engystomops pustulosus TaxID=76066 RepID=A0AAV7CB78_ENGPU|nr:hypothetical protein GDO81_007987 [Engystomops pustulosus]